MGPIQGVQSPALPAYSAPTRASKQAAPQPAAQKLEIKETAQDEKQEALSGKQEIGEAQASQVGSRFSATA